MKSQRRFGRRRDDLAHLLSSKRRIGTEMREERRQSETRRRVDVFLRPFSFPPTIQSHSQREVVTLVPSLSPIRHQKD